MGLFVVAVFLLSNRLKLAFILFRSGKKWSDDSESISKFFLRTHLLLFLKSFQYVSSLYRSYAAGATAPVMFSIDLSNRKSSNIFFIKTSFFPSVFLFLSLYWFACGRRNHFICDISVPSQQIPLIFLLFILTYLSILLNSLESTGKTGVESQFHLVTTWCVEGKDSWKAVCASQIDWLKEVS